MTVEMATRVTKVKEEVEDTKPDFHHHNPLKLQEHDAVDTGGLRVKEEAGLVDNLCHGCGQTIHDQWLLKVSFHNPKTYFTWEISKHS